MTDARLAALFFGIALLVRVILYMGTALFGTDSGQFLIMADLMREGRFDEALRMEYHPMYPLLIAVTRSFLPSTEAAGFWVSMVLGSGAVVPLFWTVRSIFGRPAAFITALLYAFQPHAVEVHADVMSEGTFSFFFFTSVWLAWSSVREPSVERSLLAGAAACAAYLTRPEGILAPLLILGWTVLGMIRHRDRLGLRLGSAGACGAAALLLASPFLLWVHGAAGRWTISVKQSVKISEKVVEAPIPIVTPVVGAPSDTGSEAHKGASESLKIAGVPVGEILWTGRYGKLLKSMGRMTYVVAVPFILLGLWGLRGSGWWGPLFYFSFPLGYLAGLLYAMRAVPHASYRYLIPSANMFMVMAALGVIVIVRFMARRWPEPVWTRVSAALLLLIVAILATPSLKVNRLEESALREAAEWVRSRSAPRPRVCSTVDKIGYLAGAKVLDYPPDWGAFEWYLDHRPADFYLFLEKDLEQKRPPYIDQVATTDRLGQAVVFPSKPQPGVRKVYVIPPR
jgi:4-amino-4-deoxy-L-arabinose transferase-like glycosyltransferase